MGKGKRHDVAMTPDEMAATLVAGHTMSLATIAVDGWPHVTAVWYAFVDGAIVFMTHHGSQKHRNLQRDNRVVGLVEAGRVYEQLRGVQFRGVAQEVLDDATRVKLASAITVKYHDEPPGDLASSIRRRAVYVVTLQSHASWDHRKLAEPGW